MRVLIIGASSFLGRHVLREAGAAGHDVVTAGRSAVPALGFAPPARPVGRRAGPDRRGDHADRSRGGRQLRRGDDRQHRHARRGERHRGSRAGHGDGPGAMYRPAGADRLGRRVRANRAGRTGGRVGRGPARQRLRGHQTGRDQARRAGPDRRPRRRGPSRVQRGRRGRPGGRPAGARRDALRRAAAEGTDIRLGPLDAVRDFVDARDVADAVLAAASAPVLPHPVINVGSGRGVTSRTLVKELIAISGYATASCTRTRRVQARSAALPWMQADITRARQDLGWQPSRDLRGVRIRLVGGGLWHDRDDAGTSGATAAGRARLLPPGRSPRRLGVAGRARVRGSGWSYSTSTTGRAPGQRRRSRK